MNNTVNNKLTSPVFGSGGLKVTSPYELIYLIFGLQLIELLGKD